MNLADSPHKLTQTENLLERMTYLCLRSRFQLGFCAPASCKHTKPSPALRSASVGGREIELRVCAGRKLSEQIGTINQAQHYALPALGAGGK